MKIKKHLDMLGLKVEDKVTGFSGVISSVSFDLYGSIQGLITPPIDKDGKIKDSLWLDLNRLSIQNKNPVMSIPDFEYGLVSNGN